MSGREAAASNALSKVLGDAGWSVPFSVRMAAARAALEAADEHDRTETRALITEAVNEETP